MFTSIFDSASAAALSVPDGAVCLTVSVVLGLLIATVYRLSGPSSKSFAVTLTLLPALVQVVITMVNGNLGAGVAVMGAFGLVRFRSVPGSSKEICVVFFAMAVGLATGMGHLIFALFFTVIISALMLLLCKSPFGEPSEKDKHLKITIPEDLDYTGVFDDLFQKYASKVRLDRVKTTNMGSMYELTYELRMKDPAQEKNLIDEIRCRNGNLTIICGRAKENREEL